MNRHRAVTAGAFAAQALGGHRLGLAGVEVALRLLDERQHVAHPEDPTGHPLTIPGLWGLLFGNGGKGGDTSTLYFTAGIDNYLHGLFGTITAN